MNANKSPSTSAILTSSKKSGTQQALGRHSHSSKKAPYKRLYIYLCVCLFFICGCKNEKSGIVNIRLDFNKEPASIHDIGLIDNVKILHLDYNKAIFGEINKIIRYNDRIYLLDINQTKSVFIYDTLGQFINVISKYGQGPNDYLQLTDIFIDTDDESLNLVSRMDWKILKYDLNGDTLIGVNKTQKSFYNINKKDEGYVGYVANYSQDIDKPFSVWIMNKNFNLENWYFKIDKTWESNNLRGGSAFSAYKSNIYYITPMDYNIYRIEKDSVTIAYSFDLGGQEWPSENRSFESMAKLRSDLSNSYILRFYNFQETDNHLIVDVVFRGQRLLGVYNKQNAQSKIVKLEAYMGEYFFGFGQIIGYDEKAIYSLLEASSLKNLIEGKHLDAESRYPEQLKNLREKFKKVDELDNPYLIIYSIN